jgi:hypothetical protein
MESKKTLKAKLDDLKTRIVPRGTHAAEKSEY